MDKRFFFKYKCSKFQFQGGIQAEREAKEKMIEEEQRKMQESILSLLHRKERERQEKMCDSVPEKSQLEKDIEQISIDKEVEKKVREDLGQNEHDKKRIQVPICNYGPSCKCNPVLPEDIFDQLEAGKEPGVKAKEESISNSEQKEKEESNLKTEPSTSTEVVIKENEQPKRRRRRRNLRTAFEYNLKVDFHDANSNFYQLLSSEDEDDDLVTGDDNEESSEESYIEVEATPAEPDVIPNETEDSGEESENSFISEYSDNKRTCNDESLEEKGMRISEFNEEISKNDETIQEATQNCDNEDEIIVEDIVDFASDIVTKNNDVFGKEEETSVTTLKTFDEKVDSIEHEVANTAKTEPEQAQSRKLSLQDKNENQKQEPLPFFVKTENIGKEKTEETTKNSLSMSVSKDDDKIVLPLKDLDSQTLKLANFANNENTKNEEEDDKSLLLKAKISSSVKEQEEKPKEEEKAVIGGECKYSLKEESVQKKDQVDLRGNKVSRSKRRKERVQSANLKLSSKKINCDKDRSKNKLEMNERSMVKPFQDVDEGGKSKLMFPRSNCRDIMSLLQQENSDDLELCPDWKGRDIDDFPTLTTPGNRGQDRSLPLPPISQTMRNRASKAEDDIIAPNWTRVPVTDIILR